MGVKKIKSASVIFIFHLIHFTTLNFRLYKHRNYIYVFKKLNKSSEWLIDGVIAGVDLNSRTEIPEMSR